MKSQYISASKYFLWPQSNKFENGFPDSSSDKVPTCQCRRCKRHKFTPWVGKIPLQKEIASPSNILAWRIPWAEDPGQLQSICMVCTYGPYIWSVGFSCVRIGHNWNNFAYIVYITKNRLLPLTNGLNMKWWKTSEVLSAK